MSVKWVKDVDSGELFPIVDEEEEFNIPEHLRASEHTAIDYEKTTKNTIADLQEQLTAAQNQIDIYKNVQAVELPKEFYEEAQQHRILHEQLLSVQNQIDVYKNAHVADFQKPTEKQCTLTDKPKHFAIGKSWILFIMLCIVCLSVFFLGYKYLFDNGYFDLSEQTTVAQQEAITADEETEENKEGFELFLPLLYVGLSVFGVRIGVDFLKRCLN